MTTYRKSVLKNIPATVTDEVLPLMGSMGLAGETGEVVDIIKKWKFQGRELDRKHLIEELGDVRWYFEILCMVANTSIEEVEKRNQAKLKKRYPRGFKTKG